MTFTPIKIVKPPAWPQDVSRVPGGGAGMPPINANNAQYAEREAFTVSGTISIPVSTPQGTAFGLIIPTDQDGDFWCENISASGWLTVAGVVSANIIPSFLSIQDIRTGHYLTYVGPSQSGVANVVNAPNAVPLQLFQSIIRFQDVGFVPGDMPQPNGFRSTATLIQPYCFTRQGGIGLVLTTNFGSVATVSCVIDIAFSGWKEYAFAAG